MKLNEIRELVRSSGPVMTTEDQEQLNARIRQAGFAPGDVYQELEMDNRYVNAHRDRSWSNSSIHLHSHGFYELLCCRNTCGAEYLVGTRRYRLQKGDILFVSPGVSHRPILPEWMPEPYDRDVIWVSTEFAQILREHLPELEDMEIPSTNLIRTAGTRWEYLPDMFHASVEETEQRQFGWNLAVLGNTMLLTANIWRALRYQTAHEPKAEPPELLDRVMAYVERHLAEKISLADTAKHFYVSESSISHLFRQKLGVSFYRCVTQRRLIAAKELIFRGQPLEEVARVSGFGDYSTFYRAFKREYGISPKQFRDLSGK